MHHRRRCTARSSQCNVATLHRDRSSLRNRAQITQGHNLVVTSWISRAETHHRCVHRGNRKSSHPFQLPSAYHHGTTLTAHVYALSQLPCEMANCQQLRQHMHLHFMRTFFRGTTHVERVQIIKAGSVALWRYSSVAASFKCWQCRSICD